MIKTLVAEIVTSYMTNNPIQADAVPGLIQTVYRALDGAATPPVTEQLLTPAVPVKRSIFPDYIICLEDGRKLKMLKRHLATSYGLTPDAYREKWGLLRDYPMVAPSYANTRSSLAKTIGLGRKRNEEVAATVDATDQDVIPDFAREPTAPAPVTRIKEGRRGKRKQIADT